MEQIGAEGVEVVVIIPGSIGESKMIWMPPWAKSWTLNVPPPVVDGYSSDAPLTEPTLMTRIAGFDRDWKTARQSVAPGVPASVRIANRLMWCSMPAGAADESGATEPSAARAAKVQ